jgi:hypothetical protein
MKSLDHVMEAVFDIRPDVVCLSALPPYALSYARTLYEALHSRQSNFDIVIGLWNYGGDLVKAAKVITGDPGYPICVTLAEADARVCRRDPSAKPEHNPDAMVAEARV